MNGSISAAEVTVHDKQELERAWGEANPHGSSEVAMTEVGTGQAELNAQQSEGMKRGRGRGRGRRGRGFIRKKSRS